jgi:hypothetical protein
MNTFTPVILSILILLLALTIRFWVESSNRDAVTEVMEALRNTFPQTDFRVIEFAGNI